MNRPAWRYYLSFYKNSRHLLLLSLFASLAQSALLLPIALLVKRCFDALIPARDTRGLVSVGVGIFFLYLLSGGVALWSKYTVINTTQSALRNLREDMLSRFYSFSRDYFAHADHGKIHTIVTQDTQRLDAMSTMLLAQFVPSLIISLVLGLLLLYLNAWLFLLMLLVSPLLIYLSRSLGVKVRASVRHFYSAFEEYSGGMAFVIDVMDLTRAQAAEQMELERQGQKMGNLQTAAGRTLWLKDAFRTGQDLISASSGIILLVAGGAIVISGRMTVGDFLSFYVAAGLLRNHLSSLLATLPDLIAGNESLTNLHELAETQSRNPYQGSEAIEFQGGVRFKGVSFRYPQAGRFILEKVTFQMEPRSTTVIVGLNGTGKTTLINLLLGFYRPQDGALYADDVPYQDLDMYSLRKQIGLVSQDPLLFHGTIMENIVYGREGLDEGRVEEAARLSGADKFIRRLPRGYDTFAGENAVLLSGGQRQRIALARALLDRPRLIVLDEPTNHLDREAIATLIDNLRTLKGSPTMLLISHDRAVNDLADQIFELKNNRLRPFKPAAARVPKSTP